MNTKLVRFLVLGFGLIWLSTYAIQAQSVAQQVQIDQSALIGKDIAAFTPQGFDLKKTPSMALVKEPVVKGKLPNTWALRPLFTMKDGKASATLPVTTGTSLYGGGEVTGTLLRNGKSITLWGTDTGAYGVDGGRRLYQSHPWVMGVRPDGSAFGIIFDSSWKSELTTLSDRIDFKTEGALFRVFVIEKKSPQEVLMALAELTGTMQMPPRWALGYQQCRFSYKTENRVKEIADTFRIKNIPCDVIWMDIDYMDGYRVFSFNPKTFPNPAGLNDYLHQKNFHSVWMIDPGVKTDSTYQVFCSGEKNDVWVKTADGQNFQGKVWPGYCSFPDFTRPETRTWWSGLYKNFMAKGVDGIWNDMNEPAVFETAEGTGTMPLDNVHRGGGNLPEGSHLLYHNVYGRLMVEATYNGILAANPDKRPFVLSRSNFLGGQRFAAAWTGDNVSSEEHMKLSVPMSLTLGLSGQPFNGPDMGGFFNNPPAELWGKWVGFGVFFPFARAHACDGTMSKEPWAFGKEVEDASRIALMRRYRLLPYYYTLFRESHLTGLPVMRPVFFSDPKDLSLRSEEQAFLIGNDLLVIPPWAEKASLPKGIWETISIVKGDEGKFHAKLKIRGGAIIPMGVEVQSTVEKSFKPLTLLICPDKDGYAKGSLYEDAGDGWGFQSGDYCLQTFEAKRSGKWMTLQVVKKDGQRKSEAEMIQIEVVTPDGIKTAVGKANSPIKVRLEK